MKVFFILHKMSDKRNYPYIGCIGYKNGSTIKGINSRITFLRSRGKLLSVKRVL